MNAHRLPFKFNPERHRRLLRYSRMRKAALLLFILSVSFFLTVALFALVSDVPRNWLILGVLLSAATGGFFYYINKSIIKEHR